MRVVLLTLVSLVFLYLVLLLMGFDPLTLLNVILSVDGSILLMALLLAILEFVLQAVRLRLMMDDGRPMFAFLRVFAVGSFVSFITPSRLAGEGLRVVALAHLLGRKRTETLAYVSVERVLDMIVLALSLFAFLTPVGGPLVVILLLSLMVLWLLFMRSLWAERITSYLPIFKEMGLRYVRSVRKCLSQDSKMVLALFLTLILWLVDFVRVWFLLNSLGVPLGLPEVSSVTALSYMAFVLSVFPGGLVFFEGTSIGVYTWLVGPNPGIPSAVLLERFYSLWMWIIIGYLSFLSLGGPRLLGGKGYKVSK